MDTTKQIKPSIQATLRLPSRQWNRNFFLLWQGQTISLFGQQALLIAMALWIKDITGSATQIGLFMALASLPGVLLAPIAGTFADRYSRIRIVIFCDILSGILVLGLGMSFSNAMSFLPLLFTATIIIEILRSFFMPAFQAAIPDLVSSEGLVPANAFNRTSKKVSESVGQVLGGVLYYFLGAKWLFIANSLSYVYAGVTAMFVRDTWSKPKTESNLGGSRGFLREIQEGLNHVWKRRGMRDFVFIACLLNFLSMPIFALLPFYVDKTLGFSEAPRVYVAGVLDTGAARYGFLVAAMGLGAVIGHNLASMARLKGRVLAGILSSGLVLGHLFLSAVGFVSVISMACVLCFASGLCLGGVNVHLTTLLQESTPNELRGRVFGFLRMLGDGLIPLGAFLGGWLGDLTGKNIPLIFGGVGALSLLVSVTLVTRRDCWLFLQARER